MTKEKIKRIHLIYGILLSISIIIAGICLMTACVGIYRSGDQPFSREAVAAAFAPIAVPVYLCLVLVVIGFLLDLFFPKEPEKRKAVKQYSLILKRLQKKADLVNCDETLRSRIMAQQKSRLVHKTIAATLFALGSILFLCYALNGSSFHPSEINASMVKAMCVLIPCMAVPFGYAVFSTFYARASIQKEIDLLKQAPACPAKPEKAPIKQTDRSLLIQRCVILTIGVGILLYGLFTGGTADVLTKAINICTECVGLG